MSDGIYFWGYKHIVGETVAVWCAGLDCGNKVVAADGSVFVAWGSDADGLFTKAYLIALSNDPPAGGFGASACHIDLTNDDTSLTRVHVDLAIGFPYHSRVQVLRPNSPELSHSQYGPSLAETRRLHQFGALVANTQKIEVGSTISNLRPVTFRKPNGDKYLSTQLYTGVVWDQLEDDYNFDGMLMVQVVRPFPTTVAALIGFMRTFDRE